jgi:hypothetical protein
METVNLQSLASFNPVTIAKLKGLKSIIRVTSPRRRKWFLVLPSTCGDDCKCVELLSEIIKAEFRGGKLERSYISGAEANLLAEYSDRIISTY